jgi:hypothetical protein
VAHNIYVSARCSQEAKSITRDVDIFRIFICVSKQSLFNCRLASKPVGQAWGWTLKGMECRRDDPDSRATEKWNSATAVGLPASQPTTSLQLSAESLLTCLQFLYYKCLCLVQYNASTFNKKWPQYVEKSLKNRGKCARIIASWHCSSGFWSFEIDGHVIQ